jgi:phosphate-selective porin OprO/OprP
MPIRYLLPVLACVLSAWGGGALPVWAQKDAEAPKADKQPSETKDNETKDKPRAEEGQEESRQALKAFFDDGVVFASRDENFELRIKVMEQTDFKAFLPTGQDPERSGLYIPRFRTYFEGHATRSFAYELSIQRSVEGTFDVLDANITYQPSDAFKIRFGRALVPYSYEWYDHLEQYFIAPERGLFPLNFGLSRQAGLMALGKVWDQRLEYAVGGFAGQLSGLADTNETRDGVAYINARPFLLRDDVPLLRFLNVGGSISLGTQPFGSAPLPLRTAIQSSENDEAAKGASPIFLDFFPDVQARGARRQGALHLAWYGAGWSLESEAQLGTFTYIRGDRATAVPVQGFNVALSYFVTGEVVERRTIVVPLQPFDPVSGHWGTGAWEPFVRVSHLHLGHEVFTGGLANADDWSNSASTLDLGANWYPNRFIKFYLDWQHCVFGQPVLINESTGRKSRLNDLLWLRAQISF